MDLRNCTYFKYSIEFVPYSNVRYKVFVIYLILFTLKLQITKSQHKHIKIFMQCVKFSGKKKI
jgi:hypothetical protein